MNKIIFRRRRAVSETIGTMLLLIITVIGAVLISNFVSDGFFGGFNQNPSGAGANSDSLQLTGFDTRDSDKLINVFSLDNVLNVNDPTLCANGNDVECTIVVADDIPIDDGTEFIALQLRNMDPNSILLQNIQINNELHEWDAGTTGALFDATSSLNVGTGYPKAGFFSIVPSPERPNSETQFLSQEVQGNEEFRIILKLSDNLADIKMGDSMLVVVNYGGSQPAEFIVPSGDAKW